MLELFISGFVLSLSLCLDWGIVNVAAFSTAATRGARPAFVLGLGSCFGDLTYAVIAMLGVTALLHIQWVSWVLWLAGSAVLIYLSAKMLKLSFAPSNLSRTDSNAPVAATGLRGDFARGVAMALASPSAILWFASVGGGLIATTTGAAGLGAWPFFLGFFISGIGWSAFVAIAGSRLQKRPGFARGLAAVSALLFAALALKLMIDGYKTLL
jgi:L-lysine exporter family protein LysE/ArgO